ncbi:hypothetical protein BGX26_006649 [Mortierella sp. AD094]|nr:hypothetical protein BGX26_006649 [Mortierella sp. AD094]
MAFDIRDEDEHHDERLDEFEEYDDVKQPTRPKFYRRRKFWICCIPTTIIAIVVAVILALYVIMPKIAQGLMNKATINFKQIDITNPSATSMDLVMVGDMQETGPFHADISFPGTVTVSWNGIQLGTTVIPGTSSASGGHGDLNLQSSFTVTNATAFAEFSGYMLNAQSFVWHLEGKLNVKALGHTVKDLDLKKDITVAAFNGLTGITIQKFSLPGDDPSGKGIIIEIDTAVNNPSSIQMYMGSLTLAISYKDTLMGYVTSTNLTMVRGPQTLSMKGVLIPQTTPQGLADTSEMMSRYIGNVVTDTTATGYDVKPDGVNSVDWLSAAVKNLKLNVPLQSPQPLQLIKSLNLGALGLVFTPPTAYQPITTSTGVLANYSLPDGFGFNIQFTQVANSFTLSRNNVSIANLNSSYNPATSNMAAGTLTFNLLQTPLLVPDASHQAFQEFNRDLTVGSNLPFNVVGQASVFANTSIGQVNLVNIPFNATTELSGLQSLGNPAPTITALQVVGGTADALNLAITVVIVNPSSISMSAGDIVLDLIYGGAKIGTVTMPNLNIVPGANTVQATSSINPAATPQGMELLNLYTSGAGAAVSIAGSPTSTTVDSLTLAFGALNIGSQMPGLATKLLAGASLVVLDTTLVNGLAQTVVTVNNPFVPAMTILSIDSTITYNGISLGTVVSTFASPPVIPGTGQGTITASLTMNTNPNDLTALIRAQAVKNGMSVDAFDALLSIGHGGNPPSSVFAGFNVADFVVKAMAGLSVDITMTTTVKVGDYQVTMPYTQTGVATTTDQSILRLIPLVGTPIAQLLVERSKIAFDSIKILTPADSGFQTDIVGAITETGPLDAQIQFPNPVTISYNGKALGTMMMPTVNAIANQGAALNLAAVPFTITDAAAYTEFTVYALNNAKFDWTISTDGLVVNAMGVALPGVTMTKIVTLDGFNKLTGLELQSYMINTIDDGGLHMTINATIANPSTIGMVIPVSNFNTGFNGKVLGPAVAEGLTLIPHGNSSFVLKATIATGNGDLTPYLTGIFQNAISGAATPLEAQGTGAPGVSWLDTAIKSLLLHTNLPPLSVPPIESVTINSMEMDFACDSCIWRPNATSTITAKTNLPFTNGAPILQLKQSVQILDKNGAVVGTLSTPYSAVTRSNSTVTTTTPAAPLVIADGSHDIYSTFIGDLNDATIYDMGLQGTADSILDLGALGKIEVKGIKIDVKTSLAGLQGLKTATYINKVAMELDSVANIKVVTLVNIHNPSSLTLTLGTLDFYAGLSTDDAGFAGHGLLYDLKLVPGDNNVIATVELFSNTTAYGIIANSMFTQDTAIILWTFPGTSKNPALAAGLKKLQTTTVLPKGFPSTYSAPPYNNDFKIKALPTTAQDGLLEMTATFNNPYFGAAATFASFNANPIDSPTGLKSRDYLGPIIFDLVDIPPFEIPRNSSKAITIPLRIDPNMAISQRGMLEEIVNASLSGSIPMALSMAAMVIVGNDPNPHMAVMGSETFYPPNGVMTVQTGPDFSSILAWWDAKNPPAVMSPSISPTVSPTATSIPSPATPSPATPSPETPSPSTSSSPSPVPTTDLTTASTTPATTTSTDTPTSSPTSDPPASTSTAVAP